MAETNPVEKQEPREGVYASSRLERGLIVLTIAVASIGLGYLFFTQLWWKLPPEFGCRADFRGGGACSGVGASSFRRSGGSCRPSSDAGTASRVVVCVSFSITRSRRRTRPINC